MAVLGEPGGTKGGYKGYALEYAEQGNANRGGKSNLKFDDQKVDTSRVRHLGVPAADQSRRTEPRTSEDLWSKVQKFLLGKPTSYGEEPSNKERIRDQPGMAPIPGAPVKPPVYTKKEQETWKKWNRKMDEWEKWRKEHAPKPPQRPRITRKPTWNPLPRKSWNESPTTPRPRRIDIPQWNL